MAGAGQRVLPATAVGADRDHGLVPHPLIRPPGCSLSAHPPRFLIHDNDAKFTRAFAQVFRTERVEIVRTPVRAPRANAIAERFVSTVRRECLDWLLIAHRRHLERVLRIFVEHYNGHRPHRALDLGAPTPARAVPRLAIHAVPEIRRLDRLGGLIHEYSIAA